MNKVFLVGRLTKDPDLKYLSNNTPVANFSIAINRPFESQNGEREADFINIVVWRKQAENIKKYIGKGSLIAIDGRIQTRNYDGQDGKKVYVTEVVAENVQFLESKGQKPQGVSPQDFNNNQGYNNNSNYNNNNTNQEINTTNISDDAFANFGDTVELSEDDIAF